MLTRLPRLAPPPRAVPPDLAIQFLFGTAFGRLAWALTSLGLVLAIAVVPNADLASLSAFGGSLVATDGTVVSAARVPGGWLARNLPRGLTVQAIEYRFAGPDGVERHDTVWRIGGMRKPGDPVTVEYVEGIPERSRLPGTSRDLFPAGGALTLAIPLIGLVLLRRHLAGTRLALHLVKHGAVTQGTFWARDDLPSTLGLPPVHHFEYRYQPEGETEPLALDWFSRSAAVLADGPETPVLYDPDAPTTARLLLTLPAAFRLDEAGDFHALNPRATLWDLALPALSAILLLVQALALILA